MTDLTTPDGDDLVSEIGRLEDDARARIAAAATLDELRATELEVAGRRSPLTALRKRLGGLDDEARRTVGKALNAAGDAIRAARGRAASRPRGGRPGRAAPRPSASTSPRCCRASPSATCTS